MLTSIYLIRYIFLSFVVLSLTACSGNVTGGTLYPTVNAAGELLRDGNPYRAIGVNYYSAFYRTLFSANDKSYETGFNTLASYKIPFARIMLGGYWPVDLQLYMTNKAEYFSRMDRVVKAAETSGVGIVASLHWNLFGISDLMNEPLRAWGQADSKTIAFMRHYTQEVVSRYKDSPAIWAWEFGNEMDLGTDLPNASLWRPGINLGKGTRAIRDANDDLRSSDVTYAVNEFVKEVRAIDPTRMISTGNALPRPYAYHNTLNGTWDIDTKEEFCNILQRDNPAGYGLMSVHVYPQHAGQYFGESNSSLNEIVNVAANCAKSSNHALFVGEFGVGKNFSDSAARAEYQMLFDAILQNSVAFAAVWVFDFQFQEGDFNITHTNSREYVLDMIKIANQQLSASGVSSSHEMR